MNMIETGRKLMKCVVYIKQNEQIVSTSYSSFLWVREKKKSKKIF